MFQWCCRCGSVVHLHRCTSRLAARNLRLVSSPAVLASGFVELGCSTWWFPFLARAVSSFTQSVNGCGVLDSSTLGQNVPSCQQRDHELKSPAFGHQGHQLSVVGSSPCCFRARIAAPCGSCQSTTSDDPAFVFSVLDVD